MFGGVGAAVALEDVYVGCWAEDYFLGTGLRT